MNKIQKKKPAPKVADPDVCPHCMNRNTAVLTKREHECHDCGTTYVPVAYLKGTGEREFAYDARLAVVIRVIARSETEAREKVGKLVSVTIAHDEGDCYISEGSVIPISLSCFSINGKVNPEREAPPDDHDELLERLKKGPQKGQPRGQLIIELGHATNELQKAGSFGGGMFWSGIVAAYEKALGYPITPKVRLGDREFDLSTVKLTKRGFEVNLLKG